MTKAEIGAVLKRLRIASGKTQKEVAQILGRTQQIIGHWETGYSQPDANTLFLLCDIYGTTVDAAFGFARTCGSLTSEDSVFLKKYHSLDRHGKKMVEFALEEEFLRCEAQKQEMDEDSVIPYPQYPTVTKRDIKTFVARNKKKGVTEEKIAELIYHLFPDGD